MTTIAGLPQKYSGGRITAARLTPCTKNATTGVLTKGSPVNLITLDSLEVMTFSPNLENEEMSGATASVRNHVPIKADFTHETREIKSANGGSGVLGTFNNSLYYLAEMITSDGTTPQLWQAVCLVESLEAEFPEGKAVDVLRGVSCGYAMYVGDPTTPAY